MVTLPDRPSAVHVSTGDLPSAVLGFRAASQGRLFLEDYLDRPIEDLVSNLYGRANDRT